MRFLLLLAALALLIPACGAADSTGNADQGGTPPTNTPPTDPPADPPTEGPEIPETPAPKTTTVSLDVEGMT